MDDIAQPANEPAAPAALFTNVEGIAAGAATEAAVASPSLTMAVSG